MKNNSFDSSKHAKYHTKNPVSRYLVGNFYKSISEFLRAIDYNSLIDLGCGEGFLLKSNEEIVKGKVCSAMDLDPEEVKDARINIPFCDVFEGSIYSVPRNDGFAELVICTEVLEHLQDPVNALKEIHRLTSKYAILSVPREPLWRILNMSRGKYWSEWGNTPDHRNHWSTRQFKKFVGEYFEVVDCRQPTPWTILLLRKK